MKLLNTILMAVIVIAVMSCAQKKQDESNSSTSYGVITTVNSPTASQNTSLTMVKVSTCTHDTTTGLMTLALASSTNTTAPFLSVKIKGFTTTAQTYTCTQAGDNTTAGVGAYYNSCGVRVGLYSSSSGSSINQYGMYRETTAEQAMTYAGTCSVNITQATTTIRGTVSCTKLVQTYLNGAARNPVDANENLDVSGDFSCTFTNTSSIDGYEYGLETLFENHEE